MKSCAFIFFFAFVFHIGFSQQILYSETLKQDNRDIYFDILGKCKENYLVYKRISRNHYLTTYDKRMKILGVAELTFIPERTFNIDFISSVDKLIAVYQYQKNNIVYCYGVMLDDKGAPIDNPKLIDTTNIGYFADNKIYTTTYSENKKNILIYKRNYKNDYLTITTKSMNDSLVLQDSTRQLIDFNQRKEMITDFVIDNKGGIHYASMKQKYQDDLFESLFIHQHLSGTEGFIKNEVSLQGLYIDQPILKYDNQNNRLLTVALFYKNKHGAIQGLFSIYKPDADTSWSVGSKLFFSSQLVEGINNNARNKNLFDDLVPKNLILKKNGGYLLSLEDEYAETMYNNNWSRNNWGYPYNNYSDYYWYNPYYQTYRPGRSTEISRRYYNNDIVIVSVDSAQRLSWDQLIPKKQYDVDNENFLSFGNANTGAELHFFFIEKDNRHHIISNIGMDPSGDITRYPTISSFEKEFEFMPRLLKQVGLKKIMIPYAYMNRIGFALINLE